MLPRSRPGRSTFARRGRTYADRRARTRLCRERLDFEEDIFRRSVQHLLMQGIRDLYIFGTAGEGYAVTERQFDEITRVFLEETFAK